LNYNGEVVEAWTSDLLLAAGVENGKVRGFHHVEGDREGPGITQGDTIGGMSPQLTYHAGKPNITDCWFRMGPKNGKLTEPYGLAAACVPK
jgi:hypothetical protein